MNNATQTYQRDLQVLVAVHGNYTRVARAIGVDRAYLYRNKHNPTRKLRSRVASEAGLIRLRVFIKLLKAKKGITNWEARQLMQRANESLQHSESL